MRDITISNALGRIGDRHIEEAADFHAERERGIPFWRWFSLAACLCFVIGLVLALPIGEDSAPVAGTHDSTAIGTTFPDGTEHVFYYGMSFGSAGASRFTYEDRLYLHRGAYTDILPGGCRYIAYLDKEGNVHTTRPKRDAVAKIYMNPEDPSTAYVKRTEKAEDELTYCIFTHKN